MSAPEETFSRLLRGAQAERLPSVSAAVVADGEIPWAEAVGLADAETGAEATPATQYAIGSITKTFTAVAIMQLRDAGALALDDPLSMHLPEAAHGPTLRRLLAHVSGLQREPPGEVWETLAPPDREGLLAGLAEAEQVLPPGARWHYSNLGFALLGEVVARRSGLDYERYVEERILRPLGLARTTWRPEAPAARGYLVEPYEDVLRAEPSFELGGVAPAGALWSTTADLCRWAAFLAVPDPAVLSPETLEEMTGLQIMAEPERWSLAFGLGLMLYRRGERILVGHDGAMSGCLSSVCVARKERIGAVVLTNAGSRADPTALALELATRALEAYPVAPEPWRPAGPAPPELAGLLGPWWSEGEQFVFRYRGGRLEARAARAAAWRPWSVFEPEGPDRLRTVAGREHGELLRIVRDGRGEPCKLYWATYPFAREARTFGP